MYLQHERQYLDETAGQKNSGKEIFDSRSIALFNLTYKCRHNNLKGSLMFLYDLYL